MSRFSRLTPVRGWGIGAITLACSLAAANSSAQSANVEASASTSGGAHASGSGVAFTARLEPGVAFPLSDPQTTNFGTGGGGSAKLGLQLIPMLDVHASATYLTFGGEQTPVVKGNSVGVAMLGGGARLHRAHADGSLMPWVDADVGYVRTGPLDRFGLSAGVGVAFQLGDDSRFWLGPYARFLQVVSQDERPRIDSSDARILIAGLSLEIQLTRAEPDSDHDGIPNAEDKCPNDPGPKEAQGCPDTDKDGVPDNVDKCPREPGPADNNGCPVPEEQNADTDGDGVNDSDDQCPKVKGEKDNKGCPRYKQVVVGEGKIELGQKIFFAFGQATIMPKSFDLLDEVTKALSDAPKLRVRVEGHTDSVGSIEHNTALSEARAAAVKDYLVGHGIAADRVESKGYGPTLPLETNATAEGRERNRRVEFVILK